MPQNLWLPLSRDFRTDGLIGCVEQSLMSIGHTQSGDFFVYLYLFIIVRCIPLIRDLKQLIMPLPYLK